MSRPVLVTLMELSWTRENGDNLGGGHRRFRCAERHHWVAEGEDVITVDVTPCRCRAMEMSPSARATATTLPGWSGRAGTGAASVLVSLPPRALKERPRAWNCGTKQRRDLRRGVRRAENAGVSGSRSPARARCCAKPYCLSPESSRRKRVARQRQRTQLEHVVYRGKPGITNRLKPLIW